MSGSSVKDIDKGYKELLAKLMGPTPAVKVGIFGEEAEKTYPSGSTVLEVATAHEFGLGVPERSFVRSWCDAHGEEVTRRLAEDLEAALAKKIPWTAVLERLGLFIQGGIQKGIAEGIPPPLAPETVDRKGGKATPLIDTGLLRSSITYKVEPPGAKRD